MSIPHVVFIVVIAVFATLAVAAFAWYHGFATGHDIGVDKGRLEERGEHLAFVRDMIKNGDSNVETS